jgi:exodeoxyribonuclease VII small subunit
MMTTPPAPKPIDQMTYEECFNELEDIVNGLETEQSTLEESLALFERGQALARRCSELLDQAELKVQQLSEETLKPYFSMTDNDSPA